MNMPPPPHDPMKRSLVDRIKGVLRLDADTFEEVEADTTATPQAAMVVAGVAVAGGISTIASGTFGLVFFGIIFAFISWVIWTVVSFFVGTRFFGGNATWDQLLRTLGFAQAPGLLNILGIIPGLGLLTVPIAFIWTIATSVVAIRQALDFTTEKAVLTAVVTVVILLVLSFVPAVLFGVGMFALGGK